MRKISKIFLSHSQRIAILTMIIVALVMTVSQATAAGLSTVPEVKPTPSPTIDPIQYQGSGISITISAAILVLIVILGVVFTLTRQNNLEINNKRD